MIEMRHAKPEERQETEELWSGVFGDAGELQRRFYALCDPAGPLILKEDGTLCSMLALPPVTLTFPDGWSVKGGYVYALATAPQARGRGYAAQLLDYAKVLLKEGGCDFVTTVPAQPSLFSFFERNGFQAGFYHREISAQPGPCRGEPLSPAAYGALRETLLTGATHVALAEGGLAFQQTLCPEKGSGLYRLTLTHGEGCAAVERWADRPVVKELLCAAGDEEEGAAAAAALCGGRARVRLPAWDGGGDPFGAICWLYGTPPPRWRANPRGWLGFAFD